MEHALHRVRSFAALGGYVLRVEFEDGMSQIIDLEPILHGELFGPLRDPAVFRAVRLDPEAHTLVWPNGADLDPTTLHDWPEVREELARRATRWRSAPADS